MTKRRSITPQEFRENATLFEQRYFEIFFKDQPKLIELVINKIFKELNIPLVKVVSVSPEYRLHNIGGRAACLDVLAIDEKGRKINIEVQQEVTRLLTKRARFYSAMLDTNTLKPKDDFDDLVETYVIFITKTDFRCQGLPVYMAERRYINDNEPFGDEAYIIFVNGAYEGVGPIADLVHDFKCEGADKMRDPELAKRARFFKDTEKGREQLEGLEGIIAKEAKEEGIEEGLKKGRAEGRAEGRSEGRVEERIDIVKKLIRAGKFSLEDIAESTSSTLEEVTKLQKQVLAFSG